MPTDTGPRAAGHVRVEAAGLETLARRLEHGEQRVVFERLVVQAESTARSQGRVVLAGMGKSGLIARKIAATLVSLGVPATFLHPAEALHGDLGALNARDLFLVLSYSGETEEVLRLLPVLRRMGISVASFCGCLGSTLARASTLVLDVSVEREACAHQLAPTASTTAMLAAGDALAIAVSERMGFVAESFAELHPAGQLGRRLRPIRELMHTGRDLPVVGRGAWLPEIVHEMSAKRLGMTTVQHEDRLLGVLSDGDLRRLMERDGPEAFHRTAEQVMHPGACTVAPECFAESALELMEGHRITSLVVTEGGVFSGKVLGVVHMHDVLAAMSVEPGGS